MPSPSATIRRVNDELVTEYVRVLRELRGTVAAERAERNTGEQRLVELGRETEQLRGERRKLVVGLAREIELFRRALGQVSDPAGHFEPPPPVEIDSAVHVEGLGDLDEIRAEDARVVESYLAVLKTLRKKWF